MAIQATPLEDTRSVRDISVTERNAFKQCRRRWSLETIENLEPKSVLNWAYDFGTGLHTGLEAYYRTLGGLPVGDFVFNSPLEAALSAFETWGKEAEDKINSEDLGASTSAFQNELLEYKELGEGMLTNYSIYAPMVDDFIVVCVEGEWTKEGLDLIGEVRAPYAKEVHPDLLFHRIRAPLVDPETGKAITYDRPKLSSRLDLIVYVKKTGKRGFWVVDHKSAASSPSDRGLDFDDQVTGYGYNFWRFSGIYPVGTIFNYLIKDLPALPRMTQRGLSYDKAQRTTPDLYMEALKESNLVDATGRITSENHMKCYEALRAKGWNSFFRRFEPTRNEQEYKSFEKRLPVEYWDMLSAAEDPELAYPHLSQYNGCDRCSVAAICQALEDGSDFDLLIETRFQQAEDRKAV